MIYENAILSGSIQISGSLNVNSNDLSNGAVSSSHATTASFASTISNTVTGSLSIKVDNQNVNSGSLSFWQGSQTEYDAISSSADPDTVYYVT
tara:strand:+ start:280 stop:558 length:279 start_codon:yes stop_codon:yes gene_type:complete